MFIGLLYYFWFFIFIFLSFLSFYLGFYFYLFDLCYFLEFNFISFFSLSMSYLIMLDWMSLIFCSLVMFISCMVVLYSFYYMNSLSYSFIRFFYILLIFIFSMMLMILSPNILSIMLGWDGLGLVSYCLVIYYNSSSSITSGMITCLTNRLGDSGLLVSSCWLISYGSWHFMYYLDMYNELIYFLLIISCFTSSAQVPFSSWLPAAMAAPTPISSLVHSSTLVTAGVYLITRFSTGFNMNYSFFVYLGLLTMFISSLSAIYEFDLKKIIALSTLSQLGLMVLTLFINLPNLCFMHMLNHAIFKSLIFLCSGIIIFNNDNNQDIRLMGMFSKMMPLTCCSFNISIFSLMGMPYLSGFYSKDMIIENLMMLNCNFVMLFIFFLSVGLTSFYSIRIIYYTMINSGLKFNYFSFIDELNEMKLSLVFLTFISVFFGCMINWIILINTNFIYVPLFMKILCLIVIIFLSWISMEVTLINNYLFNMKIYYMNSSIWFISSYLNYGYSIFYQFCYLSSFNFMIWGEYYGYLSLSFYLYKFSEIIQFYMMSSIKGFMLIFMVYYLMMF
uniref:NADH dehydrogenase subunit 5 n=1 Tax=Krisna nigromarginata TaxID=1962557 RepID=UPI002551E38E|nr:NADH dehydrogenase subunit 5 [Krisna nigromarginata]WGG89440.1 NADH dehydrogenase subunit 5 [Krisna nigromarginata]